jgi:acetoin utilization deacetylase AcuC-like enzyme
VLYIAWSPVYAHPLPECHLFPMAKYDLIPEQLLYEGTIQAIQLHAPLPASDSDILLTHDGTYWHRLKNLLLSPQEIRRTGFPHDLALVHREQVITQGTFDCAIQALQHGVAMNASGGTHHAFRDRGEGFCLLNDIAFAANKLLNEGRCRQILVVDLDVHQGNGTADIFNGNPSVFTFSMHCEANYPMLKERSDLDIGLPIGTEDKLYLDILMGHLPWLIEEIQPDFIFYLSGVDILETDKLGRMKVTRDGCKRRDAFVFQIAKKNRIPVVVSMGGGYSPRISDIVEAHCNTFRLAQEIFF